MGASASSSWSSIRPHVFEMEQRSVDIVEVAKELVWSSFVILVNNLLVLASWRLGASSKQKAHWPSNAPNGVIGVPCTIQSISWPVDFALSLLQASTMRPRQQTMLSRNLSGRLVYFCFKKCGDLSACADLGHVEFFAGQQAVTNAFLARHIGAAPFEKLNDKVRVRVPHKLASRARCLNDCFGKTFS